MVTILILLLFLSLLGKSSDVRLSFSIKPGDEGVQSVKFATVEGDLLTCSWKFATKRKNTGGGGGGGEIESESVRRPSVQSVLGRLAGVCIRKTIDYWKYEICFESEIKQSHAQTENNLGRYSGLSGAFQVYQEGSLCSDNNKNNKHRKTKVEFQCDSQLRIRSVVEDSKADCTFLMVVGTPIVCASRDFANAPPLLEDEGGEDVVGAAGDDGEETWILEIAQVGPNRVDCSARNSNAASSAIEFLRFDFELFNADQIVMVLDMHVVRSQDRVRLSLEEKQVAVSERKAQKLKLSSGLAFPGKLEFLHMVIRVEK